MTSVPRTSATEHVGKSDIALEDSVEMKPLAEEEDWRWRIMGPLLKVGLVAAAEAGRVASFSAGSFVHPCFAWMTMGASKSSGSF